MIRVFFSFLIGIVHYVKGSWNRKEKRGKREGKRVCG